MKTQLTAWLAGIDREKLMMITTIPRRSLIAAALALFAGGCYSARCEKMGFAEGTPENSRCVYQLQMDMAQQLNAIAQQMQAQQMQNSGSNYTSSGRSGSVFKGRPICDPLQPGCK